MTRVIVRRLSPNDSPAAIAFHTALAVLAALVIAGILFALQGANPLAAYAALFSEAFGTMRGFGFSLVRATPLALIALGTIVAWRSGFGYLGFEGCFMVGAAAATVAALATAGDGMSKLLPFWIVLAMVTLASFMAGGLWAGLVGLIRTKLGANEVLVSLMTNYVGLLAVQYLISGPMRAPGGLPQSERVPADTWLPFVIPGSRAHAGILLAVAAAGLVWFLLRKTPLGYELIVTGLNPAAARYGGIEVGRRVLLASFLAGGLGALAGTTELLGVQHRLIDGMSGGVGFIGIVVALLARLNPLAVVPTAVLYGGMTVGADAMQRSAGIPSSIALILQSLIVLLVLAGELLRHHRLNPLLLRPGRRRSDAAPGHEAGP